MSHNFVFYFKIKPFRGVFSLTKRRFVVNRNLVLACLRLDEIVIIKVTLEVF